MFIRFRIVLLTGTVITCAALLVLRILRLRGCDRTAPVWAKKLGDPGILRECAERRKKLLYSELIRLIMDFCICLLILLSGAYFSWFRLFTESLGGFFAGFSFLITFTLLGSIAVDWLQLRIADHSRFMKPKDKLRFFNQEILSILLIEIGINIVLTCIWGLEKLHAGIPLIVTFSFLALLAYRKILLLLKNTRRYLQVLPESKLNTQLMALLAMEGYHIRRILVRTGGNASTSYGVDLHGLGRQSLVLDRSLICTLREEEICAVVIHHLEMKRKKLWLHEWLYRGMQSIVMIASVSFLLGYIKSSSLQAEAAVTGMPDLINLSVPIIGCFGIITLLQLFRNLDIKRRIMNADETVIAKGYSQHLRNALIQSSELEMLNPEPAYELLISKPAFLPCRIEKIDNTIRIKKGECSDGQT